MAQLIEKPQKNTITTEQPVAQPTDPAVATAAARRSDEASRLVVFMHAVAFVLGFGVVFTLLGSAAGLLGASLNQYLPMIQSLGAIMLVIFGLTTIGLFRWTIAQIHARPNLNQNPAALALVSILNFFNSLLYTERRVTDMHHVKRGWGFMSSVLLGVSFSAGWVPCVGPILASILFLASDGATAARGACCWQSYSLGLGIPFLITGAAFSTTTRYLRKLNRHANVVSFVSGIFLLYVAYLLWTDSLATLTTQFYFLNEWVFVLEEAVAGLSSTGGDVFDASAISAASLAFTAGLISFLSPCVLPLVPAYIGYLSGAAVSSASQ
ncbi:MAG: hypothetical protein HC802_09365 [Caldilineaceae bacterium]|nr:hypothetical protein [Caldilineaceae bacterium]